MPYVLGGGGISESPTSGARRAAGASPPPFLAWTVTSALMETYGLDNYGMQGARRGWQSGELLKWAVAAVSPGHD